MITAERVYEVLGITPGPWGKDYRGTEHHIKSLGYKGNGTPTVCKYNDDFKNGGRIIVADNLTEEERQANGYLIKTSPEMLVALVNLQVKAESIYNTEISETYYRKIIESVDSQGRKWPELLEELER